MGQCGLSPAMMVDGRVFTRLTPESAPGGPVSLPGCPGYRRVGARKNRSRCGPGSRARGPRPGLPGRVPGKPG
ncbi:MAG: hypothetical protein M0C28_30025 [Candidatus Moduliflexus flocculans]|nr:hypothetical protein [Candidatus Moduliflexus flocculans]